MRFRCFAAVAAMILASSFASAQPKDTGPTVEIRLRSVNDLVDKAEYVAGLVGKEDAVTQLRELIKVLSADGKGIEGVDPKRPIGAYATLVKEVQTSPFVIMIPIADQEQVLKALKKHLDVEPEKNDDGTLKVAVPIINELNLRFIHDYLYVSPKAKDLNPKALLTPKGFFAKDDGSVASLVVHIDRIPAELRTFVLGQFELGVNEERKKNADKESAAEKRLKNLVFDTIIGGAKGLVDDGKELSVKFFIDAKTDELSAEVTLTAKTGTPLAKNFTALGRRTSLPAGIVGVATPAVQANAKIAVPDTMKKEYTAAIDALLADVVKKAKPQEEEIVKQLVDAVAPTLKAGELDFAAALTAPDAKGRHQFIAALSVEDGKNIEKFVRDISGFAGGAADFTFDIEKIGGFALHKVEFNNTNDKYEKIFGTKTIWFAFSDKTLVVSIDPDGTLIRKGLKAKAVSVPVVAVDVSVAKLLPLVQPDLKPDELKALLKDAFGEGSTGKDMVNFRVEGGDKLTVKLKAKSQTLRLGAGLNLLKGK